MKTTILILMAAMTVVLPHSAMAGSDGKAMPPPGPYKSFDEEARYSNPDQTPQLGQQDGSVPEWVMQRRQQMMKQWMNQSNMPPAQMYSNQMPQWNYNQVPQMQNRYPAYNPNFQNNRVQQYPPAGRNPMYGPGVPATEFYRQHPGYQTPRY